MDSTEAIAWPHGYGYCHCGCGEKTLVSPRTHGRLGLVKGEPRKWIRYHHAKLLADKLRDGVMVDAETGCWEWQGSRDRHGYGRIYLPSKGGQGFAHQASYRHHVGEIPEGLELDHLCRNPPCINPDHLEPVTHAENVRRGAAAITHCKHGHPYDAANTYVRPDGKGRDCLTCRSRRQREHLQKVAAR